jgi:hypothetical protein
MTFEFDYNTDTEQITIVYEGSSVLKASYDEGKFVFSKFEKIGDDEMEILLKNFCKAVLNALG